jgi:hypothetical protein
VHSLGQLAPGQTARLKMVAGAHSQKIQLPPFRRLGRNWQRQATACRNGGRKQKRPVRRRRITTDQETKAFFSYANLFMQVNIQFYTAQLSQSYRQKKSTGMLSNLNFC